jgi:Xylose isomerase-like TIM barrel
MTYSRRQFGKLALGSLPLASFPLSSQYLFAAGKPNSRINGVLVGVIIPYSFHGMPSDAQSLLDDMLQDGISACEMQCPPAEEYAGAPPVPPSSRATLTSDQLAAQKAAVAALTKWRVAAPMDKFVELRKHYAAAGVWIYGFKLQLEMDMPDAEYDYTFNAAKVLGADQLTMELPKDPDLTKRVGSFAAKHKLMVGYHAHTQATPTLWDEAMAQSPYNGINLDVGHYTSAGNHDQIAFIQKNHARITSIHLKDRKYPENGGQNMPWGQGDTPIKEVLLLMKKEKYKFPATIELEYKPPAGSDSEKEVARCLQYAKDALA